MRPMANTELSTVNTKLPYCCTVTWGPLGRHQNWYMVGCPVDNQLLQKWAGKNVAMFWSQNQTSPKISKTGLSHFQFWYLGQYKEMTVSERLGSAGSTWSSCQRQVESQKGWTQPWETGRYVCT